MILLYEKQKLLVTVYNKKKNLLFSFLANQIKALSRPNSYDQR